MQTKDHHWTKWLWEAWCILSVVGIWPRHIEPKSLTVNKIKLPIPNLHPELERLRILQISDLHWHTNFSRPFLKRIIQNVNRLEPDLIVFTGDFLSRAKLQDPEDLTQFLCALKAKHGHFAILGNHDYAQFVTLNDAGDYDIVRKANYRSDLERGFRRLYINIPFSRKVTSDAKNVPLHSDLLSLLNKTPFKLLHNATSIIPCRGTFINLSGLGEYSLGRTDQQKAYEGYDSRYFGLTLVHHPDAIPKLDQSPGHLILSGHTHGGQVNLPWMWKKFTYLENPELKSGLKRRGDKWIYVNRGLGSVFPFRWFAPPEITLFTLKRKT